MICTPKVRHFWRCIFFMGETGRKNKKYSAEFKIGVIMDMRENHLSYRETVRKYWHTKTRAEEDNHRSQVKSWERIYLEEGEAGFYIERRGRATKMDNPKKGRQRKKTLDQQVENDLIAENQRLKEEIEYLRAENEYIKKLSALIAAEEQKKSKKQK